MVEEWCSGYFINWDKKVYTLLLAAMSVTKFIVCTEYKEHILIREVWTSTASLHDNQIDLSAPGQTIYRDKGYFGVKPNASMDKTMHRASRNHPLSCKEKRRNKLTSFASFSDWFSSITSHVVNYRRWMIKNWGFFAILRSIFQTELSGFIPLRKIYALNLHDYQMRSKKSSGSISTCLIIVRSVPLAISGWFGTVIGLRYAWRRWIWLPFWSFTIYPIFPKAFMTSVPDNIGNFPGFIPEQRHNSLFF